MTELRRDRKSQKEKKQKTQAEQSSSPREEEAESKCGVWRVILPYLRPFWKLLLASVLLNIICGMCVSLQPLVIKYIVDSGIGDAPFLGFLITGNRAGMIFIVICAVAYTLIGLGRIFSYRFGYLLQMRAMEGCMLKFRSDIFSHIQHLCMRFFDQTPSGEIYNYIMGSPMNNVKSYLNSVTLAVPYQAVSLVISMAALLTYDWQMTLILFATACAMACMNFLSRKRVRIASREFINAERDAATYITDMLQGIDTVKTYSIEDEITDKSVKYLDVLKQKQIKMSLEGVRANSRPEFAQYLGTAILYIVGSIGCIYRGMTVGMLYAFLSSMTMILGTLTAWLSLVMTHNTAQVSMSKLVNIMGRQPTTPEPISAGEHNVKSEMARAKENHQPCVTFSHVAFTYDRKEIFHDFSCEIPHNQSVALVGRSGSGKSTFTKLLLRLYEVNRGSILFNGVDVRDYPLHDLRASFGVVPQNPFVFHDTILNNIKITNPDATDEEVRHAMEIAHITEFVDEFPEGVNTVIGDGAQSLSGGQKQRLAIARAILKKSEFLIFDEATSALDNISEKHIQHAMEELMKTHTVIIIAHRLSTIRNVDRILVFEDGDIVQQGNYRELSACPGKFRDMLDVVSDDEEASFALSNA